MAGANRVYIQVDINSASAEDNIKRLNKNLEQTGDAAKKGSDKATPAIKSISVAIEQTNKAAQQLFQVLSGLAIARVGIAMIQMGDAIRRVEISLETMTGSAAKAREMMESLRVLAAQRALGFQDLAEAAQRMKAFGFEAKEIPGAMEAIAKAASLMGRGKESIDLLTNALGVMREKGVAQASQLFRQIAAQGVDVMGIIKEKLKQETGRLWSDSDVREAIEKGRLLGEQTAEAIIAGMQKLPDAAPKMTQLVTAHFTQLRNELGFLAEKLDKDLSGPLGKVIDHFTQLIYLFEHAPPFIRTTAEALIVLAGAITAVAVAKTALDKSGVFSLASGIWGALGNLGKTAAELKVAASIAKELAPAGERLAAFATLAATIPGIVTALYGLAAAVVTVGAAFAGWGLGKWVEENIEKHPMLAAIPGLLFGPGYVAPALGGKQKPEIPAPPGLGVNQMFQPGRTPDILGANEKLIKAQIEESKAILARAEEELYRGVAAVYYKLQQEIAKNREALGAANPEAEKNLLKAAQLETDKVLKEQHDKNIEAQKNADKEMLQSRIEAVKEATAFQADMADAVVKDTAQKEVDAELHRLQIIKDGAEQERQIRIQLADEEYQIERKKIEDEANLQQLLLAKLKTKAPTAQRAQITQSQVELAQETQATLDILDAKHRTDKQIADIDAEKQTQMQIAEIQKRTYAETTELLKQAEATEQNERIASAQRQIEIMRLQIEQGDAQTARDKIKEINKAASFEIQAAQHVADVKRDVVQAKFLEDAAALDDEGWKLMAKNQYDAAQAVFDKEAALQKAYNAADLQATAELTDEKKRLQLQAQKEINEAWIAEQKEVFDKFESGVGQVFDALFSKGKGFWKSIANMAEDAGKQILKALVVPSVSAALMTAAGMPVQLEQKGDFGPGWFGKLMSMTHRQPVFAKPPQLDLPQLSNLTFSPDKRLLVDARISGQDGPFKTEHTNTQNTTVTVRTSGDTSILPPELVPALVAASTPGVPQSWSLPNLPAFGGAAGTITGSGAVTSSAITFDTGGGTSTTYQGAPQYYNWGGPAGAIGPGGTAPFVGGGMEGYGVGPLPDFGMPGAMPGVPSKGFNLASLAGPISQLAKLGGAAKAGTAGIGATPTTLGSLGGVFLAGGLMAMQGSYNLGQYLQNKNVNAPTRGILAGALGAAGGIGAAFGLAAMSPLIEGLLFAGPWGWVAAAAIGATIGLIGAFKQTQTAHIRGLIKKFYGIDIPNLNILQQIASIANSKYGGQDDLAVASPEVQQLVNLYAAATGKGVQVGPRPMYPATYTQQAGGMTLQPTYSNGVQVASPYAGTTTTQWAMASQLASNPQTATYIQLDPSTASALFQGQVVNVLNSNPTVVGTANAASNAAGATRSTQLGGLMEPSTVVA